MKALQLLLGALFFCISLKVTGQSLSKPGDFAEAFRSHRSKVIFEFDSRRTSISRQDVNILGVRTGLDFLGRFRIGAGIYFLTSQFFRSFNANPDDPNSDLITGELRFNYLTVFAEPVFLRTRRWEISFPWHWGVGDTFYTGAGSVPAKRKTIFLTEASAIGHYKIVPWFGLGGGVGYRQMLMRKSALLEDFNHPVYMINVKVFVGWIYKKIFQPEKLDDWF